MLINIVDLAFCGHFWRDFRRGTVENILEVIRTIVITQFFFFKFSFIPTYQQRLYSMLVLLHLPTLALAVYENLFVTFCKQFMSIEIWHIITWSLSSYQISVFKYEKC